MTDDEFIRLFYKTINLSNKLSELKHVLDDEIVKRFGFHYSDENLDPIIDCLDYGSGKMSFKEFKKLMKEANNEN